MKFAKLVEHAIIPTRKHSTDTGLDLYSCARYMIPKCSSMIIDTGITLELDKGFFAWITNKSKSDFLIGAGIIDQDYQGEIKVRVINYREVPLIISQSEAIAQLIILPLIIPNIATITSADEIHKSVTERGANGGIVEVQKVKMMSATGDITFIDKDHLEEGWN